MRVRHVTLALAPVLGLLLATAPACRKGDGTAPTPQPTSGPSAGPAERAGAKVDEAAGVTEASAKAATSSAGSAVEDVGRKMKPD